MRIGIDARPLEANPTGIGVYLREILEKFPPAADIVLYSNKPVAGDFPYDLNLSIGISGPIWRNVILPKKLESDGVDVYWSPIGTLPMVPIQSKKVITIHDLLWIDYPETLTLRDRIGRRIQMKQSIRTADGIIAVSQFTLDRLQEVYDTSKAKVTLITESARFSVYSDEMYAPPRRYIVAFGGAEPRKNLQFLVDCFQVSGLEERGWSLKMVGRDSSSLRHSASVEALDYVSDADLGLLLQNAGAVCFPSLYEGFGLPVLEAMAYNIPVLVSNIPAFREFKLLSDCMFDPTNADSCISALKRLGDEGFILSTKKRQEDVLNSWPSWSQIGLETYEFLTLI